MSIFFLLLCIAFAGMVNAAVITDECDGLLLHGTCYKGFLYMDMRNLPQAKQYCTTHGFMIADVIPEDYEEIMEYLTEISSPHLDDFYVALSYDPMTRVAVLSDGVTPVSIPQWSIGLPVSDSSFTALWLDIKNKGFYNDDPQNPLTGVLCSKPWITVS